MTGRPPQPTRPPKKWLTLAQVAALMQIEHPDPAYRRQRAWRLIRGLEKRDGTAYLMRFGEGKGKLWVSPTALEQLAPYSPTAVVRLREDVDELKEDQAIVKRQLNGHGARIRELEKGQRAQAAWNKIMAGE